MKCLLKEVKFLRKMIGEDKAVEYTEIFKLKEKLEKKKIPFKFITHNSPYKKGYQICYPEDGEKKVCSVIEHSFSYGNKQDLLEIMGLLTEEEMKQDEVVGYLTADDVFKRIANHFMYS